MGKEARQHGRILHPIMNLGDVNGLNKDKAVVREVDGFKNVEGRQANKILSFIRWGEGGSLKH